jgi:hypothetical protein
MAASAAEKDYVHLVTAGLAPAPAAPPKTMVRNIADFERNYENYDIGKELQEVLAFEAPLVFVAIGENVEEPTSEEAQTKFEAAVVRLLEQLKRRGKPKIFVRSSFWPSAVKDGLMRKASMQAGATFIDISALGSQEANAARSERKFEHAGVAAHPGDRGMQAIADALLAAVRAAQAPDQ